MGYTLMLGWAFLLFILLQVLAGAAGPLILGNESEFLMLFTYFVMYVIGFPLMMLILRKYPTYKPALKKRRSIKLSFIILLYPVMIGISTSISTIGDIFQKNIGINSTSSVSDLLPKTSLSLWITVICIGVVAPVMEEIIVRLFVYKKTAQFGFVPYAIWSSVVFGLFHLSSLQTIYSMFLGFIFASLMYYTAKIKYSIVLHVLTNSLSAISLVVLFYFGEDSFNYISYVQNGIAVLGVIIGVILFVNYFLKRKNSGLTLILKNKLIPMKKVFLNAGTLVYIVICVIFILVTLTTVV